MPAPWRDFGHPAYTFQEWEFHSPAVPLAPDGDLPTINPNGLPLLMEATDVAWTPDFMGTGLDGYVGGSGGGILVFDIPNFIDEEPFKHLRIQINGVWDTTPPPTVSDLLGIKDAVPGTSVPVGSDETFPGFHRWEDWDLFPNPDFEILTLDVPEGTFVNQVVIETISVPEPTSLALLAPLTLGGLLLVRRRRG